MLRKTLLSNREFLHVHCYVHILNLRVYERLKGIDDAMCKIRGSIKKVKGPQVRKQKFLERVNEINLYSVKG